MLSNFDEVTFWRSHALYIMVNASDKVREICGKNNLTLAELFYPFGQQISSEILKIRTGSQHSKYFYPKHLKVQFIDIYDIDQYDDKIINSYLYQQYIKTYENQLKNDNIITKKDAINLLQQQTNTHTPWFNQYRKEFIHSLRFSSCNFLDQP